MEMFIRITNLFLLIALGVVMTNPVLNSFFFMKIENIVITSAGKTFDEMDMSELQAVHAVIWKKLKRMKGRYKKSLSEEEEALRQKLISIEDVMIRKEIEMMNGKEVR